MSPSKRAKPSPASVKPARPDADNELNERFHALLRDAAEKREERALAQSTQNEAAARQESADLMALARSRRVGQGARTAR
jgi:hypothetical protein